MSEDVEGGDRTRPAPLRRAHRRGTQAGGTVSLRLDRRSPFDGEALFDFLGARAVPGLEEAAPGAYRRSLTLPHGEGVVELALDPACVRAAFHLEDLRDLTPAVGRCRRLLDLDADSVAVDAVLADDEMLGAAVRRHPGRRMPGAVDGTELAVRAVIGQQVSVAAARTVAARLVARAGRRLARPLAGVTHRFPTAAELVDAPPECFAMPAARRRAVQALSRAVADGSLDLTPGADPDRVRPLLLALPGVGPWTAAYVTMRALGHPDAFMPTDLGVRRALVRRGCPDDTAAITARAERWRPWRAYAMAHLWADGRDDQEPARPAP